MSIRNKITWLIVILFIGIQFMRPARNVSSGQALPSDIQNVVTVPQNIAVVLKTACYDCHSNNTTYPWYMNVEPAGWFMAYHVKNGKEELNFNEFDSYSLRKQQHKLKSIADQVKDGEMPLSSYTMIHKNAILSNKQRALIIDWATSAKDSLTAKR